MPDGERVEVRCAAPMRWAPYVSAAVEFGLWAFLTPEERERAIETERARVARVEAEIDGISRFNAVVAGAPPPASPEPRVEESPRELRRQSPISITVPTSPLDGAKIRRVRASEGYSTRTTMTMRWVVAAVAAAAATEAFDSSPPTMSVEEGAAATTRWLEDATMELPAAEVPSTSPLESVSGHQGRADAVDRRSAQTRRARRELQRRDDPRGRPRAYGRRRAETEALPARGPASPRAGIVRLEVFDSTLLRLARTTTRTGSVASRVSVSFDDAASPTRELGRPRLARRFSHQLRKRYSVDPSLWGRPSNWLWSSPSGSYIRHVARPAPTLHPRLQAVVLVEVIARTSSRDISRRPPRVGRRS